jgi:hypothetical protein
MRIQTAVRMRSVGIEGIERVDSSGRPVTSRFHNTYVRMYNTVLFGIVVKCRFQA